MELGNKVGSTDNTGYEGSNTDSLLASEPTYEVNQYFVHPDHLGSSSHITDITGEVYQHTEYLPFGEIFVEERNSQQDRFSYLYNSKELDEMTGLYYYGARYYSPRESVFLGCDPLMEKYPGLSPFAYCANNPIMFVDPDGMQLKGVNKDDATKMQEDINTVFADKKFDDFRKLITLDKKGKTFNKISAGALTSYLANAEGLTDDDMTLIAIVANTVNSEDVHEVEYAAANDELPDKDMAAPALKAAFDKNGWTLTAGLIGSQTKQTKDGTYALIVEGGTSANDYQDTKTNTTVANPGGRAGTSFHENFGHGRSLVNGRGDANQHPDAIRLENLTLRVIGKGSVQRTGTDHGPKTPVNGASKLPEYR